MSRDRSLEEFFEESAPSRNDDESEPSDGETNGGEGSGELTDGVNHEEPGEGAASDSMAATYRWSAEGGICGACGEQVESRWHSDEAFVCADCKEW